MSDLLLKIVGKKILCFRLLGKKSQEEIAFKAGITTTYLSQIENGKRDFSISILYKLAIALNKEVGELFPPIRSSCI